MADIKKFLDKAGVSVLWSRIAEELDAKQTAIENVKSTADTNAADIVTMKGQIEALEEGTYDDSEIRGLIEDNAEAIGINTAAIATLNGNAETAGSVAHTATTIAAAKVAEIVANADADFDTLKEIADWILSDTTGAAKMATDISDLQTKVGSDTVANQIADAIDGALNQDGSALYATAASVSELKATVDDNADNIDTINGKLTDARLQQWDAAEANVQSDWSITDETSDAYIKNKPTDLVTTSTTFPYTYNGVTEQKTIAELMAYIATLEEYIADLQTRVTALETPAT